MSKIIIMKRIFAFLLIMLIFIFVSFNNDKFLELCSYYNSASLSIFCENYTDTPNTNFTAIKNGDSYIIQTKASQAGNVLKNLMNCSGFLLTFNGTKEDVNNLLKQIKIVKTENYSDIQIFYCYICGLVYSTIIDNKKVNLQIAINNNIITIGSPLILGSY